MTMITIQSQVDTVVLSLGACRLYGDSAHVCNVCGRRREWNRLALVRERGRAGRDTEAGVELDLVDAANTERAKSPLVLQACGVQNPVYAATVRTKRPQRHSPRGARSGVRITLTRFAVEDLVEGGRELIVAVDEERVRSRMPVKRRLRACGVTQAPSMKKQDVVATQRDRRHGEHVAGECTRGFAEGGTRASLRRSAEAPESVGCEQERQHGARRDADDETWALKCSGCRAT
jgi:hypothetical protein